MKKYLLVLLLFIPFSALSQKSLLPAPYTYRVVIYGFSKASAFGTEWSPILGVGGIVKINDVFFVGMEYSYIVQTIQVPKYVPNVQPQPVPEYDRYLHGAFYGANIGVILLGNSLFHILVGSMIGQGELTGRGFFVAEPRIMGEVNITDYVQLGFQLGYHFSAGANEVTGIDDSHMRGISLGLNVSVECITK